MLKPTRSKFYLTLFLSFNIFFAYVLQGFYGIDIPSIIAGYPIAPHYSLFFLVIIVSSYIFAFIVTLKLPQFWQPSLPKIVLALLFELILFIPFLLTDFIPNITDFILNITDPRAIPPSTGTQPAINPCPSGAQFSVEDICGYRKHVLTGGIVFVTGYLAITFVAYALSYLIVKAIKREKK